MQCNLAHLLARIHQSIQNMFPLILFHDKRSLLLNLQFLPIIHVTVFNQSGKSSLSIVKKRKIQANSWKAQVGPSLSWISPNENGTNEMRMFLLALFA